MFVPMIISIALGFIDCSQPLVGVALLTVGVGMIGCVVGSGFVVNLNDIGGRNYSGVLYGISNTFWTIPGIIAPYFVGLVTPQVILINYLRSLIVYAPLLVFFSKGNYRRMENCVFCNCRFLFSRWCPVCIIRSGRGRKVGDSGTNGIQGKDQTRSWKQPHLKIFVFRFTNFYIK